MNPLPSRINPAQPDNLFDGIEVDSDSPVIPMEAIQVAPPSDGTVAIDITRRPDVWISGMERVEMALIDALIKDDQSINQAIPDDIEADLLWSRLLVCCKAQVKVSRVDNSLRMYIGRCLEVLEKRPDIYRGKGYKNWSDFIATSGPELYGVSVASMYRYKRVAGAFPSMPLEKINRIGISKLNELAGVTDETKPSSEAWIQSAENMTVAALKDEIAVQQSGNPTDGDYAAVLINTTKEISRMWFDFRTRAEVQAYCGTRNDGMIFRRLMEECMAEWIAIATQNNLTLDDSQGTVPE